MEVITMNTPNELKYSKSHEWLKTEDGVAVIGISDYAQDALGDVVFINLPAVGDTVTAGESFGDVESVKAVSDLISPVSGVICEVNEALDDAPETLNEDELREVVTFACTSAGLSTTKPGGISSVHEYQQILDRIAAN